MVQAPCHGLVSVRQRTSSGRLKRVGGSIACLVVTLASAREPAPFPGRIEEKRRTSAHRITGLDVGRALAVFGLLGAHLGAVPDDVQASPSGWLGAVNGRSSILFARRPYQGRRGCPLHL
jgi:hypothetical protein